MAQPVNILLVDDQPGKLIAYETILSDLGENLIKASSGQEALECLLKSDIAVILADVCMPDLDGYELASMIRQHPRFQKTSIIFVSATLMSNLDRVRGYQCGGVDYVPVPVVPEILRAKVSVFVELYRKTRELHELNRSLEERVAERTAALEATASALRTLDQRKDEFLATLAHELRGPLAPLRNMLEVLKRADHDPVLRKNAQETMDRQLRHMVRLVDDLLDVGRIAGNKLELRTERTDLTVIVRQSVEACRPALENAGHLMVEQIPSEPIPMNADPVRLTQVVTNVLNNACKYTPKGGRVQVKAWREGGNAYVSVLDNGRGIPPDLLPRVFDMFTQVGRSFDRNPGGLGVGLTLVKRLVELHGGQVTAHSDGPGHGSEFVIRVPVLADTEARTVTGRVLAAADGGPAEPRLVQ